MPGALALAGGENPAEGVYMQKKIARIITALVLFIVLVIGLTYSAYSYGYARGQHEAIVSLAIHPAPVTGGKPVPIGDFVLHDVYPLDRHIVFAATVEKMQEVEALGYGNILIYPYNDTLYKLVVSDLYDFDQVLQYLEGLE